jgi:hypothetical protein
MILDSSGLVRRACLSVGLVLLLLPAAPAGTAKPSDTVATSGPIAGVLLKRAAADAPWQFVDEKDSIPPDVLLIALPDATLFSANKNVRMKMIADIGHRGPLPVFESAVRIHKSDKVDLDVTVERGIVGFANLKTQGAAQVRLHLADQTWNLKLLEPDTKVGLEIHGRYPPGLPHFAEANGRVKLQETPTMTVFLIILSGKAAVEVDGKEYTLDPPPGPAKLRWDNVLKQVEVTNLDKLPDTLEPQSDEEKQQYAAICNAVRTLRDGSIDDVLEKALNAENPVVHRGAVVVLGALDKLPRLTEVLASSKYPESRDKAVVVLRNWLGRWPGQADAFYEYLTSGRKLTPAQAKTAIHLSLGFDEAEQHDPVTYEVLIQSLKHSKLAVRELARWHLVRLAPEGKSINYDAGAPEAQRERAYEQWRALIPTGQLPPHLRSNKAEK